MKITKFEILKNKIESICVPENTQDWKNILDQARKEIATTLDIKGFRKGKIPIDLIDKYVKSNDVLNKAVTIAERRCYEAILKNHKNELINKYRLWNTKIDKVSFTEFQITYIWQKLPTIKITKWKDFDSKIENIKVSDNEIKSKIDELRSQLANFDSKNAPAAKGDYLLLNYQGEINNKIEKNLVAKEINYHLGSGKFGVDFDNNLLGINKKEKKDFETTLPNNYAEKDIANKKVKFNVEVIDIKIRTPIKSNDELISKINSKDIKTIQDLENIVAKSLKQNKSHEIHPKILKEIWEKILLNTNVDIPSQYLTEEAKAMKTKHIENLEKNKKTFVDYLKDSKQTEKTFDDQIYSKVKKMLTDYLIIKEISEKEKITVAKEEVDKYYDFLTKTQKESMTDIKAKYPETLLFHNLLRYKVEQFLVDNTLNFNTKNDSKKANTQSDSLKN